MFPLGATTLVVNNDFPVNTAWHSLTVIGGYTVNGNAIVLGAGGMLMSTAPFTSVHLDVTLSSAQTWTVIGTAQSASFGGALHLNGQAITFDVRQTVSATGLTLGG